MLILQILVTLEGVNVIRAYVCSSASSTESYSSSEKFLTSIPTRCKEYILTFTFYIATRKTKDSEMHGSMYSSNLICS
jgi:hypothetical protein